MSNQHGKDSETALVRSEGSKIILTELNSNNPDDCTAEVRRSVSTQSLNVLNQLRINNQLCDAKIRLDDGSEFAVHRAILSANSEYFRALFTNGMGNVNYTNIYLKGVDGHTIKCILEWCYTRKTTISKENIENLLPLADQYHILGLLEACSNFLKSQLHIENVIGLRRFANNYFLFGLEEIAHNYMMYNFQKLVQISKELVEMNFNEFYQMLSSDELNVRSEEFVFETIIKWIDHEPNYRKQFVLPLLKCVRMTSLSKHYFIQNIKSHPYIRDNDDCKLYIIESIRYMYELELNINISNRLQMNNVPSTPRLPHETLFVFGGWSGTSSTNLVEIYNTRTDKWSKINIETLHPRAYHGCVSIDNTVYVIGGFDGFDYFNTCLAIDTKTKKWREIGTMHQKRCYVSVARHGDFIYALGGYDGQVRQNTGEKYNIKTNQWTYIAPMHAQRSDAYATVLDGKVYICGGFNGTECLDSAECYDPHKNQWTLIAPMRNRRSGIGVIAYNNHVYAIGGFNGVVRLNSCEKYDPKTKRWLHVKEMFELRSNFAVAVLDGFLYAIGGYNSITTIPQVECYDAIRNEWLEVGEMHINRSALSACVIYGLKSYKDLAEEK